MVNIITSVSPTVKVRTLTSVDYVDFSGLTAILGDKAGLFSTKGLREWHKKLHPSDEKLRIWQPPKLLEAQLPILILEVTPYQWFDLQRQRQLQPIGDFKDIDPLKWMLNAVVLTANGLIQTSDGNLVFHYKKGGAKEGSIHTFGGYVQRDDVGIGADKGHNGRIEEAILRELAEKSELGLKYVEMQVEGAFGTPEGMPSVLWGYGTGAIYFVVETSLSSKDLRERLGDISADETLGKGLFFLSVDNVGRLDHLNNLHPQTRQVVPTIQAIYSK